MQNITIKLEKSTMRPVVNSKYLTVYIIYLLCKLTSCTNKYEPDNLLINISKVQVKLPCRIDSKVLCSDSLNSQEGPTLLLYVRVQNTSGDKILFRLPNRYKPEISPLTITNKAIGKKISVLSTNFREIINPHSTAYLVLSASRKEITEFYENSHNSDVRLQSLENEYNVSYTSDNKNFMLQEKSVQIYRGSFTIDYKNPK